MAKPAEPKADSADDWGVRLRSLVSPARAMGWFLRTWREEWAGLSRAQVAAAMSAHCTQREHTTVHMVRQWERGQPPHSSEQLVALLGLVTRHGLPPRLVEQLREVAYAACAALHYPELLDTERLLEYPDLDQVAVAAYAELFSRRIPDPDLITLVGIVCELQRLLADERQPKDDRQVQRLTAALAGFRACLAMAARQAGDFALRYLSREALANAAFLDAHYGAYGLGGPLSVLAQEVQAETVAGHMAGQLPAARRLLVLAKAAETHQEPLVAGQAYVRAVHYLAELGEGNYETMSRAALTCLARDERSGMPGYADYGHRDLAWGALAWGANDEAIRRLASFADGSNRPPETDSEPRSILAWIAAAGGDLGTTERLDPQVYGATRQLKSLGRPMTYSEWLRIRTEKTRRR